MRCPRHYRLHCGSHHGSRSARPSGPRGVGVHNLVETVGAASAVVQGELVYTLYTHKTSRSTATGKKNGLWVKFIQL